MIKEVDLTAYSNADLTFRTWYAMETDWDYGYVAVSLNGNVWDNLPGTLTTTSNPNGNNLGNGITGQWWMGTGNYEPGTLCRKQDIPWLQSLNPMIIQMKKAGMWMTSMFVSGTTTIFSDDAETPARMLNINVSYPHLTLINPTDPLT